MAAKRMGVKVIVHSYHGNLFEGYFNPLVTKAIIKLEKFLAKRSSALIALSAQQKKVLSLHGITAPEKIKVVYPGIDKSRLQISEDSGLKFRKKYSLWEEDIVVAIVGRLVEIKNIRLFIDGIKYLSDKGMRNVRGMIVGDGPEKRKLKEYSWSQKLGTIEFGTSIKVAPLIFTSWCRDISFLYSAVDILVLTSRNEGTPYSLIEAQASGIPIVAADVGGVSDIVDKNNSAYLFNTREEFFSHLESLVMDVELRKTMGVKGREYASQRFESHVMAEETKKIYLDLIQGIK